MKTALPECLLSKAVTTRRRSATSTAIGASSSAAETRPVGAPDAALPDGKGIVVFGGYTTLNADETRFTEEATAYEETYVLT